MNIIISNNTGKPIYEQITDQVKSLIIRGELVPGEQIPSMRVLAKKLHISVITVQRAYEDLQRDGFIETTIGRGSFISGQNIDFVLEEKQKQLEEYLQKAVKVAREIGVDEGKIIQLVRIFYEEVGEE
ncbi:GntR family transcriptional regulator [Clostridium cadaveris]|uniref:GntR family transcriptional regulator n=1 Tax=Clostridium cadaveris TaxID=1529 RepID=A0A1I2JTZ6_9CLOT|nr:GntR family transcriptional regulator [Clostridium cadaveris]SFF57420.1 GntR family transcriptional regulator [Clostridium cadaveris]